MRRQHIVTATSCSKAKTVASASTPRAALGAVVMAPVSGKSISTQRVCAILRGGAGIVKTWWGPLAPTIAQGAAAASTKPAFVTTCSRGKGAKIHRPTPST